MLLFPAKPNPGSDIGRPGAFPLLESYFLFYILISVDRSITTPFPTQHIFFFSFSLLDQILIFPPFTGAMVAGSPILPPLAWSSPKWEVKLSAEEKRQRQHRPLVELHQQQGVRQGAEQQQGGEGGGVGAGWEEGGAREAFLSQAWLPPPCLSIPGHLQGSTR